MALTKARIPNADGPGFDGIFTHRNYLRVLRQATFAFATHALQITILARLPDRISGYTVTFSVAVTGVSPPAYQWLENTTNLTDIGNLSGSATRILTITNLVTNNAGNYSVIVTNAFGSATSAIAALTITSMAFHRCNLLTSPSSCT